MPKTPTRHIRIPDDEWLAAQRAAVARGETVTDAIRRSLRRYATQYDPEKQKDE